MSVQLWTYLLVGITFALYIGIAIWSRASSTKEFYVAGGGVSPLANGMATAADWMSAASFISMAGLISFLGYETQNSGLLKIGTGKEVALGDIFLRPNQTLLDEVVLSTNQSSIQSKIDRQVYGASEFSIARGGNAADLIRNIPSISIWAYGGSVIRQYLNNEKLKKIVEWFLAILLIITAGSVLFYNA